MKTIGFIEHPRLKITVFKMDTRITVQIENEAYVQSYKFKQEQLATLEDVQRAFTPMLIQEIESHFKQMHQTGLKLVAQHNAPPDVIWDVII